MTNTHIREMVYQVAVLDATNQVVAVYDDFVDVSYRKQCNRVGMAVLTVPEGHAILDLLEDDTVINIYIGYPSVASVPPGTINYVWQQNWKIDYEGLYRDRQIATDADGNIYYLLYFPSMMEILSRYIVAWPAGVTDRSEFSATEAGEIIRLMVQYNCTADATVANGRLRTATVIRGLTAGPKVIYSASSSYSVGGRNLLEIMQEVRPACNFDFDVIPNTDVGHEGEYYVKQYLTQLGTGQSTVLIFDLSLDNLSAANMLGDRLREKTEAIVGGTGTGSARTYVLRTGDNSSATNEYELFVDASAETDTGKLNAVGDNRLGEMTAVAKISASVVSSLGYIYLRHYGHGDTCTVRIGNVSDKRKIDAVDVHFSPSKPVDIRLELADAPWL